MASEIKQIVNIDRVYDELSGSNEKKTGRNATNSCIGFVHHENIPI